MNISNSLKFVKFNWKFVGIMITVLLLILAIFYVYKQYIQPKVNPDYINNKEFVPGERDAASVTTDTIDIMMFTVDWCPYCKKAKPIWQEFKSTYDEKVINGYKINVKTINATNDEDSEIKSMLDRYNIEGFPTIKLIKNGKTYDYDAKPEKESLKQFLDVMTN